MNSQKGPNVAAVVRSVRFVGVATLLLGVWISILALQTLVDPTAVIRFNGVATSRFSAKLALCGVVGFFPLIGMMLALFPRKIVSTSLQIVGLSIPPKHPGDVRR